MQPTITRAKTLKPKPDETNLGFGTLFTDHMFNMDYSTEKGWHSPRIEPYAPISMDPSTMVLHYGQAVFEGLKAYGTDSGGIQLFRPADNFKRMNRSGKQLCIPAFDEDAALDSAQTAPDTGKGLGTACAWNVSLYPTHHCGHRSVSGGTCIFYLSVFYHFITGWGLLS